MLSRQGTHVVKLGKTQILETDTNLITNRTEQDKTDNLSKYKKKYQAVEEHSDPKIDLNKQTINQSIKWFDWITIRVKSLT